MGRERIKRVIACFDADLEGLVAELRALAVEAAPLDRDIFALARDAEEHARRLMAGDHQGRLDCARCLNALVLVIDGRP